MNTRDAALAKVRELAHFVGGRQVRGESGRFGDVFNPTTGALSGRVPLASRAEAERAIAVAKEAFAGWSETSPLTRARVMFRFKELIERHMDELALLIASEHGKVLSDAKGSIQRGLEVVEFACGIPHLMKGEFSDNISAGMDLYSIRQPLGVCAAGSVNGKRVQALGGAKNHMVVMPDADIEVAAEALMGAAYGSAGERCMAISVAVPVTDRTASELIEAMTPRIRKLKIGPSTDNSSEMGPLVTREHRDKVRSYVDLGVKEGASLVVDGRGFKVAEQPDGFFLGGSLFDKVRPEIGR